MRSTDAEKKEREIAAVRTVFARVLGGEIGVTFRQHETPDVLADLPDGTGVAVEVVEPANERLAESMASLARLKAAVIEAARAAKVDVNIHMRSNNGFIPNVDRKTLARAVTAIIALAVEHAAGGAGSAVYDGSVLYARGIPALYEIRMWSSESPMVLTGTTTRESGGSVRERVQTAIKDKSAKIDAYRAGAPSRPVWLVVAAGLRFASGTQSEAVVNEDYESAFDRTFYVDAYDKTAFELRTRSVQP